MFTLWSQTTDATRIVLFQTSGQGRYRDLNFESKHENFEQTQSTKQDINFASKPEFINKSFDLSTSYMHLHIV